MNGGSRNHTEKCRTRIEEAISRTDCGKTRLESVAERLTRTIVEQSEQIMQRMAMQRQDADEPEQMQQDDSSSVRETAEAETTAAHASKGEEMETEDESRRGEKRLREPSTPAPHTPRMDDESEPIRADYTPTSKWNAARKVSANGLRRRSDGGWLNGKRLEPARLESLRESERHWASD